MQAAAVWVVSVTGSFGPDSGLLPQSGTNPAAQAGSGFPDATITCPLTGVPVSLPPTTRGLKLSLGAVF